jgi:outer membrane protein assembly factor BamB
VLYKGLFFSVTDQGVVSCYRAETGELLYKDKVPHGGNRASLVAGDGKVYVFSGSGQASVVAAEPTFRIIATNDLGEALAEATPAVADGCLLVRGDNNLYCIGAKG